MEILRIIENNDRKEIVWW